MRRDTGNIDIFLIISSAAAIMFLVFTVVLYGAKEREKNDRVNAQNRLDKTLSAKEKVDLELREAEIENAAAKANLKAADDKLEALSRRLEELVASDIEKTSVIKQKDETVSRLKADLEELRAERDRLVVDLEKSSYDYRQLKVYLDNVMKTNEEMDRKAKEISERYGVSLGTIVLNQNPKNK